MRRSGDDTMAEMAEHDLHWKVYFRESKLPKAAQDYLNSIEDLSLSSRYEYIKDLELFFEYLIEKEIVNKTAVPLINIDDLSSITTQHVQGFLEYLNRYEKKVSTRSGRQIVQVYKNGPRGKERKRVALYNLYRYLVETSQLSSNPVESIKIETKKVSDIPTLSRVDLYRMLEVALHQNPDEFLARRNYVIIKLLAFTGIRIGELVTLNIEDIWQERNEMAVTRIGGEKDILLIPSVVRKDLFQYVKMRENIENIQKGHKGALFLSQQMRRIHAKSVRKMIRKIGNLAGVQIPVTPQTFRKTYGKRQYQLNQDIRLTSDLLGYRSTQTFRQIVLEDENA